jgi:hypothetical protein
MTNTSPLPITVDGTRLDTLAYNIETLTGMRSMPRTRSGDVVVPGLHGVVSSLYDDYEAGELALRMWVRDTDEAGKHVLTDVHRKQQLDRNLDRVFALFRSSNRLLDVRMSTGRDPVSQYQVLPNQRCDISDATVSQVIRTNTVTNPVPHHHVQSDHAPVRHGLGHRVGTAHRQRFGGHQRHHVHPHVRTRGR